MAEEKKTPEKQGWFKKLISWIASLPGRIAKAFTNMVAELRKVTWPSKKKLISSCIAVLLFMVVVGAIVSLLDVGSAAVVNGLYKVGHPAQETQINEGTPVTPTNLDETGADEGADPVVEGTDPVVEEPATEGDEPAAEGTEATTEGTEPAAEGTESTTEETQTAETETTGTDEGDADIAE